MFNLPRRRNPRIIFGNTPSVMFSLELFLKFWAKARIISKVLKIDVFLILGLALNFNLTNHLRRRD
jgi:hypothetical protein